MSTGLNFLIKPILRKYSKVFIQFRFSSNNDAVKYYHQVNENGLIFNNSEYGHISEDIIRNKLKASSINFIEGYTCFCLDKCGLCAKKKKLSIQTNNETFINKKTGFFLCYQCQITGSWSTFSTILEKPNLEEKELLTNTKCIKFGNELSNWKLILENSVDLTSFNEEEYEKTLKDFKLIPPLKNTSLCIRVSKNRELLYFPLLSGPKVVGYKTFDKSGVTQTFPKTDCPGILLFKTKGKTKSAVIVAKIQDFMALASQNLSGDILCLPYGSSNLPQSTLPLLECYEKLILWLGEMGGLDSTGNFAKKLHDKRCYSIRPIKDHVCALTAVTKNEDIESILKKAKPTYHEFITTFNSLREDVLAEIQNKERITGVTWKRFPKLNSILKGHRRGELTVLTGPTGCGKTTFMSEYSLDLATQGVNTLWGSFEIKNSRLARTMLQQYSGCQLENNIEEFGFWADKFEQLPIYFMTFHGQHNIKSVMETVEHCYYTYDIAHVVIDNVQFMIEVLPQSGHLDRFWKQDYAIQCFRSFATKNNCHVTLVMHPRKGYDGLDLSVNSIFGGAKASQEADNIFIIQTMDNIYDKKKFFQVSKNRFSGELGKFRLFFNKSTLSFGGQNPKNNSYFDEMEIENLEEKKETEEFTETRGNHYYSNS